MRLRYLLETDDRDGYLCLADRPHRRSHARSPDRAGRALDSARADLHGRSATRRPGSGNWRAC
ncbi:MAG: hypothetical protein WDN49_08770 [Acetobacteraceae bacterium]